MTHTHPAVRGRFAVSDQNVTVATTHGVNHRGLSGCLNDLGTWKVLGARGQSSSCVISAVLHPVVTEMSVSPTPSRERAAHGRQAWGAVGCSQDSRLF